MIWTAFSALVSFAGLALLVVLWLWLAGRRVFAVVVSTVAAVLVGGGAWTWVFIVVAALVPVMALWRGRHAIGRRRLSRRAFRDADPEQRAVAKVISRGWAEHMYRAGLTVYDTRREGVGWRKAMSETHRRVESARRLAEGTEARAEVPSFGWVSPSSIGLRVAAGMARGNTRAEWEAACERLAPLWRADAVRLAEVDRDLVLLDVVLHDPLGEPIPYDLTLPASIEHVPFAVDESGQLVHVKVLESNLLLGGEPGGGKSGGHTAVIAGLARLPHVALIGLDPKRVELPPWRERFTRIAVQPDDATAVLRALVAELERRYDWLELNGRKKMQPSDFTDETPLIALIVDELAELLAAGLTREDKAADAERATLLRRLVALGRAAGIFVEAATQKPDEKTVPTNIRDLMAQRVGYRTGSRAMTETIMGAGRSQDAACHEIKMDTRGVAYSLAEGQGEPSKIRTLWFRDEDIQRFAAETAYLRPSWRLLEVEQVEKPGEAS